MLGPTNPKFRYQWSWRYVVEFMRSKYLYEKSFSNTSYDKDLEAKDTRRIANIVSVLDIREIRLFYGEVRSFYCGENLGKIFLKTSKAEERSD